MAIRSGIGIGEAQIFDTSGVMNTYFKLIQQQQAQQAKYQKELADAISKVDLKNLDPSDSKYVLEKYNEVKDLRRGLYSIKNPVEQKLALSKVEKSLQDIQEYTNNARRFRENLVKIADDMNRNPEDFDDSSKDEVKKLVGLPYYEAIKLGRGAIDSYTYQRVPDMASIPKYLDNARKLMETSARDKRDFILEPSKKKGYEIVVYKSNPKSFADAISMEIAADNKAKYQFKQLYKAANPDVAAPTDEQLIDFARQQYEKRYGQSSYAFAGEPKKIQVDKPDKLTSSEKYINLLKEAMGGRQQALTDIYNLAGGNIASVPVFRDGKIVIKPNATIRDSRTGVKIPYAGGEMVINNIGDLVRVLDELSINKGNIDVLRELRQTPRAVTPPKPSQPKPATPKKETLAEQMKRARSGK